MNEVEENLNKKLTANIDEIKQKIINEIREKETLV